MPKKIEAIFIVVSTIVGLGVFLLPFSLSKSGVFFWLWFLFLILAKYLLHLCYGEIIFQVSQKHNLPGLAERFLGEKFKFPIWLFDFVGIQLIFLTYLLALSKFFPLIFPISPEVAKFSSFTFVSLISLFSLNPFAAIESIFSILIIILFLTISIYLFPQIKLQNIIHSFTNFSAEDPFLSYGILIFALTGYSSLLLVYDLIGKDVNAFKKINLFSLLIVFALYSIFTISVYGTLGNKVTEESLSSLKFSLPNYLVLASVILAALNIFTTFISLAFYLKRGLIDDFGFKPFSAWICIIVPMFVLSFLPLNQIAKIASVIGSLFIGVNLIVILLCYQKLKKIEYFGISKRTTILLIFMFAIGWLIGIALKN